MWQSEPYAMNWIQEKGDLNQTKSVYCKLHSPNLSINMNLRTFDVRCIDHSMHRAAYHFIRAIGVPSMTKIKHKVSKRKGKDREVDEPNDNEDASEHNNEDKPEDKDDDSEDVAIDVSMAIEADADDPEAMAATMIVDYNPGDALGKLMALVNQLRMSSEGTREYLFRTCIMQNVKPVELLLWIRTRWGSLTHCLESTLSIQKVRYSFYYLLRDTEVCMRGYRQFLSHGGFK
jgi:hypothetical protein